MYVIWVGFSMPKSCQIFFVWCGNSTLQPEDPGLWSTKPRKTPLKPAKTKILILAAHACTWENIHWSRKVAIKWGFAAGVCSRKLPFLQCFVPFQSWQFTLQTPSPYIQGTGCPSLVLFQLGRKICPCQISACLCLQLVNHL